MKRIKVFLVSVLTGFCLIFLPGGLKGQAMGDNPINFRLHDVYGHVVDLRAFKGKWVLLNFWATWCGPCRKEIPSLEKIENQARSNMVVLGISESLDGKKKLLQFVHEHKMTYPILIDGLGHVADEYRVHALPRSVLIDPQGNVQWIIDGAVNWMDPTFQKKFLVGPLKGQS